MKKIFLLLIGILCVFAVRAQPKTITLSGRVEMIVGNQVRFNDIYCNPLGHLSLTVTLQYIGTTTTSLQYRVQNISSNIEDFTLSYKKFISDPYHPISGTISKGELGQTRIDFDKHFTINYSDAILLENGSEVEFYIGPKDQQSFKAKDFSFLSAKKITGTFTWTNSNEFANIIESIVSKKAQSATTSNNSTSSKQTNASVLNNKPSNTSAKTENSANNAKTNSLAENAKSANEFNQQQQQNNNNQQYNQTSQEYTNALNSGDYATAQAKLQQMNTIKPNANYQNEMQALQKLQAVQQQNDVNTMTMQGYSNTTQGNLNALAMGAGAMAANGKINEGLVVGGLGLLMGTPEGKARREAKQAELDAKKKAESDKKERIFNILRSYSLLHLNDELTDSMRNALVEASYVDFDGYSKKIGNIPSINKPSYVDEVQFQVPVALNLGNYIVRSNGSNVVTLTNTATNITKVLFKGNNERCFAFFSPDKKNLIVWVVNSKNYDTDFMGASPILNSSVEIFSADTWSSTNHFELPKDCSLINVFNDRIAFVRNRGVRSHNGYYVVNFKGIETGDYNKNLTPKVIYVENDYKSIGETFYTDGLGSLFIPVANDVKEIQMPISLFPCIHQIGNTNYLLWLSKGMVIIIDWQLLDKAQPIVKAFSKVKLNKNKSIAYEQTEKFLNEYAHFLSANTDTINHHGIIGFYHMTSAFDKDIFFPKIDTLFPSKDNDSPFYTFPTVGVYLYNGFGIPVNWSTDFTSDSRIFNNNYFMAVLGNELLFGSLTDKKTKTFDLSFNAFKIVAVDEKYITLMGVDNYNFAVVKKYDYRQLLGNDPAFNANATNNMYSWIKNNNNTSITNKPVNNTVLNNNNLKSTGTKNNTETTDVKTNDNATTLNEERNKPFLGITYKEVKLNPNNRTEKLGLYNTKVILVQMVVNNSSAALAGLRQGDIITAINGTRVDLSNFQKTISSYSVGNIVSITYLRYSEIYNLNVTLTTKPIDLGITYKNEKLRESVLSKIGVTNREIFLVTNVTKDGLADKAGLQKNDLIISINDQSVAGENLYDILKIFKPGDVINIKYLHGVNTTEISSIAITLR